MDTLITANLLQQSRAGRDRCGLREDDYYRQNAPRQARGLLKLASLALAPSRSR